MKYGNIRYLSWAWGWRRLAVPGLAILFTVACQSGMGAGSGDTADPATSEPEIVVESLDMAMLQSFPVQARLVIRGRILDGCGEIADPAVTREGNLLTVALSLVPGSREACDQEQQDFEKSIPLPIHGLPRGDYEIAVGEERTSLTLAQDNILEGHSPPPPE